MRTVLFHVNQTTVTVALGLCLAGALALARWRRPDPARFRRPMRGLLAESAVVYLAVLLAPIGGPGSSPDTGRSVVWDPLPSFQDTRGAGEHAGTETEFGPEQRSGDRVGLPRGRTGRARLILPFARMAAPSP